MEIVNGFKQQVVRVTGKGDTKQKAFASALSQVQKQVVGNEDAVTLQIQPLKVIPVTLEEEAHKEHFLFIFFPRIRRTYQVTLDIEVSINTIDLTQLTFMTHQTTDLDLSKLDLLKGGK
ncbi:DUF4312 family protein [Lactiplantibacillus mudanjiangensis]|uniref:Cytoplasmic protein [Lactobacillus pentosus] n=1 Tax=Lactiplantibacillus mudanjiangensis TaxID=1296538 RepID=A0A660E265_9LACO|nr:DUF4312 family protein [Lactiplantibacillus mudanjiangensis]VDG22561.1 cytoplasmic protein [Lactobacillus pentosus] [Lactiplantibacillus mudanjiangensis]VDG26903.1 cytoplasmic protein [Lactobacillus pentosus] [Lactiplantibacillus mudanjiangensis]